MEQFLEYFKNGRCVMVHDDEREEEGDIFILAEYITPEIVHFLLKDVRGMLNVAMTQALCEEKGFTLMQRANTSAFGTNFCVLVDAKKNVSTGISAADRAKTIQLMAKNSRAEDFVSPGHTGPLMAMPKTERFGHTEASVELAKYVGVKPVVAICEILNAEGKKATWEEQKALSLAYNIPLVDIKDVRKVVFGDK